MIAFGSGRRAVLFWLGVLGVAGGVALHIPMFLMSADMGYQMAGMEVDAPMLVGMALIVLGTALAGWGLLPDRALPVPPAIATRPSPPGQAGRLTAAHWKLMLTLALALVIDTMKPASLGFVVPGMADEYGLTRPVVALLPFVALTGTAVGSIVWGYIGDFLGRRAAILLASIMFIGTSICGAMPAFEWNLGMCFLMGAAAGGLLPIAFTLLAETVPPEARGWALVLLGGLGLSGGFLAASACAAWLEPMFGWRIMWALGLPTGILLILLNGFIPESPRFLLLHGRVAEAEAVLARFGAALPPPPPVVPLAAVTAPALRATTISLNLAALAWGLVNFGLLLWLPAELRARGYDGAAADGLLARSALLSMPTTLVTAWLYWRFSAKWTLVGFCGVAAIGLIGLSLLGAGIGWIDAAPVVPVAILMIGNNALIAVLLPYSAESYPARVRGRATGWVAGSSKLGGIGAQLLSLAAIVPAMALAAPALAVPVLLAGALIARFGLETRGRRLEDLDAH